jgi:regulator of cell morphogenesis and NO signaling
MELAADTHVADIAAHNPAAIPVLQRHGIDFCCGGRRPLAEVCHDRGLDVDAVRDEIAAATAETAETAAPERDWTEAPLADLTAHIVTRYHGSLRVELPRLAAMADRVLAVHGAKHPDVLPALVRTLQALRTELESHIAKEEQILFPWIEELERRGGNGSTGRGAEATPATPSVGAPIAMMESEHDEAAGALAEMLRLTGGYQLPEGACTTFRGLYHGLAELEDDLHRHIHLENHVLFPRALALEGAV